MSHRRAIRRRLDALRELKSILGAMRTLALVEIGKLGRLSTAQRKMVSAIERAAADFFAFAPTQTLPVPSARRGTVVFGSERGFCGGFNTTLAAGLAGESTGPLVLVGRHLGTSLPEQLPRLAVEGATAAEEIPAVVARLATVMSHEPGCDWTLVHHDPDERQLRRVSPLVALERRAPLGAFPPRFYEPPHALASELVEHYVTAVLLDVAYASFLAENRERLRHMEGAIQHLDDELGGEGRRLNAIRQEEITEEIEILLLGSS